MLASTENGASPRLSLATGIWCAFGEGDQLFPAFEGPLAPRRDDFDRGLERVIGQLESHLVVALASGAVTDGVGASLAGNIDLRLGNQRPGDGGAEQIHALVKRVGAEHREHVVADELLAQILDEDVGLLDAQHLRLAPGRLQLLALAEVGGEGDHLGLIGFLQPFEDDRCVQPARVGEHDLFHLGPGALGSHAAPRLREGFAGAL